MAGKWAELAERTGQSVHEANSTLQAFLKPLLHPDPAQRPTLAAMLNHPYLQHAGPIRPPLTSEPVQMSVALPSMHSVMPTVQPPALLLPEMGPMGRLCLAWGQFSGPPSHTTCTPPCQGMFSGGCVNAACELTHPCPVQYIGVSKSSLLSPKQR